MAAHSSIPRQRGTFPNAGMRTAFPCPPARRYVAALLSAVDQAAGSASRAVILFAHSHGAVAAYGLARALGPRARKLLICARRSVHGPTTPLLREVWGVETTSEFGQLSDQAVLRGLVSAYKSIALAPHAGAPRASWPPAVAETVGLARRLYSSPLGLCSEEDIALALGSFEPPVSPPLSLPVVALAAEREAAQGETAAKMAEWSKLTSGRFRLHTVPNVDHMGIVLDQKALAILVDECVSCI
jgi:surfactin synthase thioesterase subunit